MSFFLKSIGYCFVLMATFVSLCVIAFAWTRHGLSEVGGMFAMGGGLDIIVLTFSFGPGIAMLLAGYWMDHHTRRAPADH